MTHTLPQAKVFCVYNKVVQEASVAIAVDDTERACRAAAVGLNTGGQYKAMLEYYLNL